MGKILIIIVLFAACTSQPQSSPSQNENLYQQNREIGRLQEKTRWMRFMNDRAEKVNIELQRKPMGNTRNLVNAIRVWAQPLPDSLR